MAQFGLELLGPFRAKLDGRLIDPFRSSKAQALLAYLVVESHGAHSRQALAALLWRNSSPFISGI